jgi:hypothetical protein
MDIGPAELLLWGKIPRYRPLVTSVTDHQNACDLGKRFRQLNAKIRVNCSCDLLLLNVTFISLTVASRSGIISAAFGVPAGQGFRAAPSGVRCASL